MTKQQFDGAACPFPMSGSRKRTLMWIKEHMDLLTGEVDRTESACYDGQGPEDDWIGGMITDLEKAGYDLDKPLSMEIC